MVHNVSTQTATQPTVVVVVRHAHSPTSHVVMVLVQTHSRTKTTVVGVALFVQALKSAAMVNVVPTTKQTVVGLV